VSGGNNKSIEENIGSVKLLRLVKKLRTVYIMRSKRKNKKIEKHIYYLGS